MRYYLESHKSLFQLLEYNPFNKLPMRRKTRGGGVTYGSIHRGGRSKSIANEITEIEKYLREIDIWIRFIELIRSNYFK